jgi:PDZ domain-containing protein
VVVPVRWWPLALVALALVGPLALLVDAGRQVPFFAFTPGDAQPVGSRLEITKAKTYDPEGEILFVTVGVPRLTGLSERFARRNNHDDIVPARDLLGDQSPQENRAENLKLMGYSKDFATYVALKRLGYDVQLRGGGAAIDSTCLQPSADGKSCAFTAPAGQQLRHDDVIVAIDGAPVHLPSDIPPLIAGKAAGDEVTLTVKRLGQKDDVTMTVPLIASPDDATRVIIGFIPNGSPPADLGFEFPVGVGIDSGQVSGPSAGLAFTLALLDKLSPGELTGGVKVAATGTMSPSGAVGAIGGLRQKTVAVQRSGAKLFLVPESEKAEAIKQAQGSDLKVIGVTTIDDALRALADLGGNAATLLPNSG